MRNCLILGSGRSGTSLVAGMVQRAGYYLGEPLQPPNRGNPLGRFESIEVNAINEALLAQVLPRRRRNSLFGRLFLRHVPLPNQRWLAAVPVGRQITATPALLDRMARLVEQQPYCFKDPRYSYTLPAWRSVVTDAVFICVFRHPAVTAASILRERQAVAALHSLALDFDAALRIWTLMYRHIVEQHRRDGCWLFVHYEQILYGNGVARLGDFLDAALDDSLIDPALYRSRAAGPIPNQVEQLYAQLCALAEWTHQNALSSAP